MPTDPYSATMVVIVSALNRVLDTDAKDHMSEGEYTVLTEIAMRIAELDPDSIHITTEE